MPKQNPFQFLKSTLAEKSGVRWLQLEVLEKESVQVDSLMRALFPRGYEWVTPEQMQFPEVREGLSRSSVPWCLLDALHLSDNELVSVVAKSFLSGFPHKRLMILTRVNSGLLNLPSYLGEGRRFINGSKTGETGFGDDSALLEHSRRIEPKYQLEDLITGPKLKMKLAEAIDYIKTKDFCEEDWGFRERHSRGHGVTLVLHGESGTGKTMAAECIASTLGLPLYQVDLASIVSKYVGDTEKNLKTIFKAARSVKGILLFDEGDAIFGSRTEVKGSNDRYANLEVNFLLQELESFDGITILSTNHEKNMDDAFLRRFTYALNFGRPSPTLREKIWSVNCPKKLPLAKDVDFSYLGKFLLTGGNIRNCVRDAAAIAASQKRREVCQLDFLWAIKRELQKYGIDLSREMIGDDQIWRRVGTEWEYKYFKPARGKLGVAKT